MQETLVLLLLLLLLLFAAVAAGFGSVVLVAPNPPVAGPDFGPDLAGYSYQLHLNLVHFDLADSAAVIDFSAVAACVGYAAAVVALISAVVDSSDSAAVVDFDHLGY